LTPGAAAEAEISGDTGHESPGNRLEALVFQPQWKSVA
jgi:hypothetical protein